MSTFLPLRSSKSGSREFHLGPENHWIGTAVRWIVEEPPPTLREAPWNPITFYGPSGCGKTHLLAGIYQAWKERHPKKKAISVSGADFASGFAIALDTRTVEDFRKRIRCAPLWIMDRLEDLKDKPAAMEELLLALDESLALENTILFATGRFPGDLSEIPLKLRDRLIGGLTIPILPPSQKTRTAMIQEIALQLRIPLSQNLLTYLVKTLNMPYPALQGTLTQIVGESENRVPDANFIRKRLKENVGWTQPAIEEILRQTAKQLGIKQSEIKGKSRMSSIVQARAITIYLSRQLTDHSLKEIGRFIGGRDHKTVAHHCDEIERKLTEDAHLRNMIARIREQIAIRPRK
ncbi:MAG: DnaA/Hda family protein [Planctomycetaceae bacterium]|nr:DnaA/Hda family protein [Planctomycetaceae bacterium]